MTGAASGIGRDVARRLSAEGARASMWDLNTAALGAAAAEAGAPDRVVTYRFLSTARTNPSSATARIGPEAMTMSDNSDTLRIRDLAERFRAAIEACDLKMLPITFHEFPRGSCATRR